MTNDISETNPEEAVPCFALSKNDSYVMSASGGKISLFNMMTFKVFINQCFWLDGIACVSVLLVVFNMRLNIHLMPCRQ